MTRSAITVMLATCLLSSCAGARPDETRGDRADPGPAGPSSGGVIVLVSEPARGGMDALGGGRLEVLGDCLGAGGSVIIWPHGTDVVEDDPLTIDIPDSGTFTLGDEVQVPGGHVWERPSGEATPGDVQAGGVTVPASCAEHDIFLAH